METVEKLLAECRNRWAPSVLIGCHWQKVDVNTLEGHHAKDAMVEFLREKRLWPVKSVETVDMDKKRQPTYVEDLLTWNTGKEWNVVFLPDCGGSAFADATEALDDGEYAEKWVDLLKKAIRLVKPGGYLWISKFININDARKQGITEQLTRYSPRWGNDQKGKDGKFVVNELYLALQKPIALGEALASQKRSTQEAKRLLAKGLNNNNGTKKKNNNGSTKKNNRRRPKVRTRTSA